MSTPNQTSLGFDVHLDSGHDHAIERTAAALKVEGFGILTKIDVRQTLREKLNEEFRPFSILGACNPLLAHRSLSRDSEVGLLLPCNVTVEADPQGGSVVRFVDPVLLLSVGRLASDPVLKEVAMEARIRLLRAAEALKTGAA